MTRGITSVFLLVAAVISLATSGGAATPQSGGTPAQIIAAMLTDLHSNGEFTGSVLVAASGTVIYRDAIARTPEEAGRLLITPSNIGSLAKGFTAMAVMILAERGRLRYDDLIASHVRALADATPGITLRHLLTHTSGIPDVGDLNLDQPRLRERDVLKSVRANHSRFVRPGTKYRYSNVGYMLLAMVVENVSRQRFDEFLREEIFAPLDMKDTRPVSGSRAADETKGDGGLVSTGDDLLKWDQGLATNRLVRAETFAESCVPFKVTRGESTYAFGWNIEQKDGDTYMWHTGNAGGGPRAFMGRRLNDRLAIIILTTGNSRRIEIADAIVNIVHGRGYAPPRLSGARKLFAVIDAEGVDAALVQYQQMRETAWTRYDFSEPELNSLGYMLLDKDNKEAAIRVFELNVRSFPTSSNAFDSLGDALSRAGRRVDAVRAYARASELDPSNVSAQAKLHAANQRPWSLFVWIAIGAAVGIIVWATSRGRSSAIRHVE